MIAELRIIAEASFQVRLVLTSRTVMPIYDLGGMARCPSVAGLNWRTQRGKCQAVEQEWLGIGQEGQARAAFRPPPVAVNRSEPATTPPPLAREVMPRTARTIEDTGHLFNQNNLCRGGLNRPGSTARPHQQSPGHVSGKSHDRENHQ
jgi:hypothetical protein